MHVDDMGTTEPITILYIEDDETNRELLGFIIAHKKNWRLIAAENGENGLEKAAAARPEVILLDISLPDIDGPDVLQRLQQDQRTAAIPVIAVSGNTSPTDIAHALRLGFKAYLNKPIELEKVYRAIEEALN